MNSEENDSTAENLPQPQDPTSKLPAKGAEEMRLAADMVLEEKCIEIARALADSSIKGHIQSARFLYLLAEGRHKIEAAKVVETLQSLAIELAMQPDWREPAKPEAAKPDGDAPQRKA